MPEENPRPNPLMDRWSARQYAIAPIKTPRHKSPPPPIMCPLPPPRTLAQIKQEQEETRKAKYAIEKQQREARWTEQQQKWALRRVTFEAKKAEWDAINAARKAKLEDIETTKPAEIRGVKKKDMTKEQRAILDRWTRRNAGPRVYKARTGAAKERDRQLHKIRMQRLVQTEGYRERKRAWDRRYNHSTPQRRLYLNLLKRIRYAIGPNVKSGHTMELTGCTACHLKAHLEAQFLPGMTWKNYGRAWHVDHEVPCCYHRLEDPEEQRRAFHYTNLRPLWKLKNLKRPKKGVPVQANLLFPAV